MFRGGIRILPLWLVFWGCSQQHSFIRIKGSDTEVNLVQVLAESFHKKNPDIALSVSGGGSGLGIATLLNGLANIANSSRPMNEYEKSLFQKQHIEVMPFVFAQDALAIIVHASNPTDSLTLGELANILSGRQNTWPTLSNNHRKITIYGRQNNSGTYHYLSKQLGIKFPNTAREMNGNAQIIEAIKQDPSGIGYVGVGYVYQDEKIISPDIKIIPLTRHENETCCSPTDTMAIHSGKYPLQRPLYQYILRSDYQQVKPFLDFEKSEEGKNLIKAYGYFPA